MSENHNVPVILYDSKTDRAGVLMSLDYFEENFDGMPQNSFSGNDYDECVEEDPEELVDTVSSSVNFLDELEEEHETDTEEDETALLDQTNEELALWKSKREEKEREEIEKTLEEELLENPLADPFEEDTLHTPEWHQVSNFIEEDLQKPEEPPKEPSYHPVINSGGSLSWTDWTFTENSFTPIPQKTLEPLNLEESENDLYTEETADEPIFLEEPV